MTALRPAQQRPDVPRLGQTEFIAMIAMLFATIAFSIDSMLPALPQIARELTPDAPNAAQLILTSFVFGMGLGTLFAGPLSDTFGRKPVIMAGAVLYCLAAVAAYFAPTLETVLLARVVQGLGAAGPRVVSLALVRDLHKGREMARIMSFAMMVFMLVPAVAPFIGAGIIALAGWRAVFLGFLLFSLVSCLWLGLRQAETIHPEDRRPLQAAALWEALRMVLSHRVVVVSTAMQTLFLAGLFATLSATQPIFDVTFGRASEFPMWFALIALMSGTASFLNARLVMRIGMRGMIGRALLAHTLFTAAMTAAWAFGLWPEAAAFWAHLVWTISVFFVTGLTMGNLNALAMEPVGHQAGMASSVIGAISTVLSVVLAVPVGLAFDGSPLPLMIGVLCFGIVCLGLMRVLPKR
ncbi:multidrug effflux MFS transporter [Paragemmobacter straminiformis]|uniref:Multidrug effflux MFS transporter n=1 Tax=Paragemmobacter straminiformis TaxID=2045119 RepID=A0A842I830_9RHOB|nr:multidrug effflux MFS transporter [Gemmobacter straminiformis]MBC2835553.1 multidrug effflux MFS transporter [Gemmobacter straminiformis]